LNWDEISAYLNARYVCAPEAMWRILGFNLQEKTHAIIKLAVHLPDMQLAYFRQTQIEEAIEKNHETTLTAWFRLKREDPEARSLNYIQVPEYYKFDKRKKEWKRRCRMDGKTLSRMYFVSPKDGERFYLRMLLLKKSGATSFEDLRTVDGVLCENFREAAMRMNLLEEDDEWDKALQEASGFQMPT